MQNLCLENDRFQTFINLRATSSTGKSFNSWGKNGPVDKVENCCQELSAKNVNCRGDLFSKNFRLPFKCYIKVVLYFFIMQV